MLKQLNKDVYYLEEWAEVRIEGLAKSASFTENIFGDKALQEVLNEADNIRFKLNKEVIEPLHLLAAIATPGVGFIN